MSSSPAFKWFTALLLTLTLAWKLVAGIEGADNTNDLRDKVLKFLAQHRFEVAVTGRLVGSDMPIISAARGSCHMQVAKASAFGWDRDLIRSLATNASENLFIVFQGRIYDEQPTLQTAFNELWSKFLRQLGFEHATPVLAVMATEVCDAKHLSWDEVS